MSLHRICLFGGVKNVGTIALAEVGGSVMAAPETSGKGTWRQFDLWILSPSESAVADSAELSISTKLSSLALSLHL